MHYSASSIPAELFQEISKATAKVVSAPAFIDLLGAAIAGRLRQFDPYPFAIEVAEIGAHVLVEPRKLRGERVMVLTQLPLQGGTNVHLVLMARDLNRVGEPKVQGQELENYGLLMYIDQQPGNLQTRTIFGFDNEREPELIEELRRQLSTLELKQAAFLYMNVLSPQPAA